MSVTIHINGTSNSLAHKGSTGIAKSTIPDVCKTPSPGGPVPIPYPVIISMSNSLAKGTKTVKVEGKQMAAVKGSELSRCNGDEPGTAGGVKSSTNMKEAKWILYSFDVKLDGKNACRLSDKLTMNHGNTACLGGWLQRPVIRGSTDEEKVACAIYCCDRMEYKQSKGENPNTECARLGAKKHNCVLHSLRDTKNGKLVQPPSHKYKGIKAEPTYTPEDLVPGSEIDRNLRPDIKIGNKVIDAKFPCDPDRPIPSGNKKFTYHSDSSVLGTSAITDKEDDYFDIPGVNDVTAMTPADAQKKKSDDCDCAVAHEREL